MATCLFAYNRKGLIQQPHIVTDLPKLPDTAVAAITVNLSLKNNDNALVKGKLKITISPETFSGNAFNVEKEIALDANAEIAIKLSADDIKQLLINKPH